MLPILFALPFLMVELHISRDKDESHLFLYERNYISISKIQVNATRNVYPTSNLNYQVGVIILILSRVCATIDEVWIGE
jgi:hypothetical protein